MAKFWRVMGIILIVVDVIGVVILMFKGGGLLNSLVNGFFGGLSGALMITVGGLVERVEGLEYDMSAAKSGGAPVTFLQAQSPAWRRLAGKPAKRSRLYAAIGGYTPT